MLGLSSICATKSMARLIGCAHGRAMCEESVGEWCLMEDCRQGSKGATSLSGEQVRAVDAAQQADGGDRSPRT